jgi:hypothetical protein
VEEAVKLAGGGRFNFALTPVLHAVLHAGEFQPSRQSLGETEEMGRRKREEYRTVGRRGRFNLL